MGKQIVSKHHNQLKNLLLISMVSLLLALFSSHAKSEDEYEDEFGYESDDELVDKVEDVTVYQDCGYGGNAVKLKPGVYHLPQLEALGVRDNDLSSIRIPQGYKVILFDAENRRSRAFFLRRSKECLAGTGYNDKVSSMVVRSLKHATVYQHCFLKGHSVLLAPGKYNLKQLKAMGVRNDDVSSIRLPPGLEIRLFEHDNFRGRSVVRKKLDSCLDNQGFDNVASSIIVAKKGSFRHLDGSYEPDPPQAFVESRTQATVYQHCIMNGKAVLLSPGKYNLQQLNAMGIGNNEVSSIDLPTGLEAQLFEGNNFQGRSIVKKKFDFCLDNEKFNNVTSSIVITQTGPFEPKETKPAPAPVTVAPVPPTSGTFITQQPANISFGCDKPWRWISGSISVESSSHKCDQDASISNWIIRGVGAKLLRAKGYAEDQSGKLILVVTNDKQQLELMITNIRSTSQGGSQFRYGTAPDSPLIGTGKWERLQR